nr:bHLH transcription factor anthocyanin regulator [Antirrhinum majus]
MAAPPTKSRLQCMLQAAVQAVQWTYSLFWQPCPQQGILVWRDGYYNGVIKTRKTVQPTEVSTEEASLQRSQQLKELYDSLAAGESNSQAQQRRPSASLSPEDLTESEWYYLMCVSFSFPPGLGLPGKAYTKRQHVWITGANEVDSKIFSRTILAKSAGIQTVVCIPMLDGVLELGTTSKVKEDIGLIRRVKSHFNDGHNSNSTPRPALSEHSTSNPRTISEPSLHSSQVLPNRELVQSTTENSRVAEEEEEEEEEENENEAESDSDAGIANDHGTGRGSELMQLDHMAEDVNRLWSPDHDGSNNLDSDMQLLKVAHTANSLEHHLLPENLHEVETVQRWLPKDSVSGSLQPPVPPLGFPSFDLLSQDDTHYSRTVSSILENESNRWSNSSADALYTSISAFTKWQPSSTSTHRNHLHVDGNSQWALKYILFTVPYLNTKSSTDATRKGTPQDELNANHVLAERRRREKLNERFIILRSLVPFVTKMDKASILGDTIEYVKQLRKKIEELEAENVKEVRSGGGLGREKRKLRIVERGGGPKAVEVSIIESDALVEIQCLHKEGLLFDVMHVLRKYRIEVTSVQSSVSDGNFVAELRAKVKENVNGRKASITEVKKAINEIMIS